jgi:Xaa-Pro aminopeptidase
MGISFTGLSCSDKRSAVAGQLTEQQADAAVLTQLDSICWLLNIRGLDVSRLPVVLAHAIVHANSDVELFVDQSRLPAEFPAHVGSGVTVYAPSQLSARLAALSGQNVLLDQAGSSAWFSSQLNDNAATIIDATDPCVLLKAQKNPTELSGMQASHRRDGAAMARFLCWLDKEVASGKLHDEGQLSDQLERFRRQDPTLVDLSFDTISAASTNAAMCHYNHLNQDQPAKLSSNSMYLVDSGGQYPDGTTDITRTVAIGIPTDEMKQQFTLVLKGHIALASARFPAGTTGHQLDVLARQFLWASGYDYDHGTGHGVGHFLNVHEGPQRVAKVANGVALLPGMVLSNEPGYYREQQFGIRIENLEQVVEHKTAGDFSVLGFESLTRCPIDLRCIESDLLSESEKSWLNNYHQKVWHDVSPLVDGEVLEWLKQATKPLS